MGGGSSAHDLAVVLTSVGLLVQAVLSIQEGRPTGWRWLARIPLYLWFLVWGLLVVITLIVNRPTAATSGVFRAAWVRPAHPVVLRPEAHRVPLCRST